MSSPATAAIYGGQPTHFAVFENSDESDEKREPIKAAAARTFLSLSPIPEERPASPNISPLSLNIFDGHVNQNLQNIGADPLSEEEWAQINETSWSEQGDDEAQDSAKNLALAKIAFKRGNLTLFKLATFQITKTTHRKELQTQLEACLACFSIAPTARHKNQISRSPSSFLRKG